MRRGICAMTLRSLSGVRGTSLCHRAYARVVDRSEALARFGDVLKDARSQAGLLQDQVATAAGIDQATISKWERGIAAPDLDVVLRIEKVYGLRPGALTSVLGWMPCEPTIAIPPIVRSKVQQSPTRSEVEQLAATVREMSAELAALRAQVQPPPAPGQASDPSTPRSRRRRP